MLGNSLERALGEFLDREVPRRMRAVLGDADVGADWIDQSRSPLGRRTHLSLARAGAFPSRRVGKKVLARRRDLDAYILAHPSAERAPAANDEGDEIDLEIEALVMKRGGR